MNILLCDLKPRTLQLLLISMVFELGQSAPQRSYSYPYLYQYFPHRYSRNSRNALPARTAAQSINSAKSGFFYNPYTPINAIDSLKSQNDSQKSNKKHISKADMENAKFAGVNNQEADESESEKTALSLFNRNRFRRPLLSPCFRDSTSGSKKTTDPKGQGRFLFDLNVYNIYPNGGSGSACGGLGSGLGGGLGGLGGGLLGGGGILSDFLADTYAPPPTPLQNFLTLFAPGILQNALAATARPPQIPLQDDTGVAADPAVDPGYNPRPLPQLPPPPQLPSPPIRRPNRVFYDSPGAAPITPAQLLGGVATTVNGIIQQLTGNVQPVYPSYRSRSYG